MLHKKIDEQKSLMNENKELYALSIQGCVILNLLRKIMQNTVCVRHSMSSIYKIVLSNGHNNGVIAVHASMIFWRSPKYYKHNFPHFKNLVEPKMFSV